MMILSAADRRFAHGVEHLQRSARYYGYRFMAYDLGGLGFGTPMPVNDRNFIEKGYYHTMVGEWKTRALHKPAVIADCLSQTDDWVAYLDADTMLVGDLNAVPGDYDVGVTVRRAGERCEIIGRINAGVIFFAPTKQARAFVDDWQKLTVEVGNDQRALNLLHQKPGYYRYREFPTSLYNWYYFQEEPGDARILHFKDNKDSLNGYIENDRKKRGI